MAEALAPVPDPVVTALSPGPWMPADGVARSLARRLAPDEASDPPPEWLRQEQVRSFRRALHAVRGYGGALLADPVGTGKTFVALAAAAVLNRGRPTACLVPATLIDQWRRTAGALEVPIVAASHQSVSRGRLPEVTRGLVLVDESHHFRNPTTWRYRYVAPWLVGRPLLLVTATPVVNRLQDLLHQLLLGVRNDALAADGVASLRALLGRGRASPALGRLVVESPLREADRPARRASESAPGNAECAASAGALQSIDRLRLSRLPGTEALVRTVLRRATASSPAALAAALRRYRGLLLHARDAAGVGRRLDRAAIRRFTGELEDQLVWWQLVPGGDDPNDLALDDLDRLDEVLQAAVRAERGPDGKVERLRALLGDGRTTLIFTGCRETVRYLRDRLDPPPAAWCTGTRSGLGHLPVPRVTVLGWFRERSGTKPGLPPHLVVTDVAAEGLDLQRAERVVHYDLPWTPMRLEQREGRALRLGSLNPSVEVVSFRPSEAVERALRIRGALARKARLPALAGLGPAGRGLWRWRSELADAYRGGEAAMGTAVVARGPPGVLAGFELYGVAGEVKRRLAAALVWIEPSGEWTEEEQVVAARLAAAAGCSASAPPDPGGLKEVLALLGAPIRCRLAMARGSRWSEPSADPVVRRVALRLHQAIRQAARQRDVGALEALERALAFVGRGHTAGEAVLLERLAGLADSELASAVARVPDPGPRFAVVEAQVGGILLFGPGASGP